MKASPRASLGPFPCGEGSKLTNYRERKSPARELRRDETEAEQKLWSRLRDRKLGGFKFRRQFPMGVFLADFCCVEARLVIEADGNHHRSRAFDDINRARCMEDFGFRVMRFWNHDILTKTDSVCEQIMSEIKKYPSPIGRGRRKAG